MERCILALDVGGTYIKHALIAGDGVPVKGTLLQTPAYNQRNSVEALASLRCVVKDARMLAERLHRTIEGMAVAFPGPFDYDKGIPLMKHKYQALYNLTITPALSVEMPDVPIVYLHDSTAFMLGEAYYGAAKGAVRPAGMMLGTGLGFACMADGRVRVSQDQRPAVRVWDRPFRDGIAEDVLSARGLARRYEQKTGKACDAKEIARRARGGEAAAQALYQETGEALGEVMSPIIEQLHSDRLVVGGQMARSAELFLPYAKVKVPVLVAEDLDAAALRGAYAYFCMGRDKVVEIVPID